MLFTAFWSGKSCFSGHKGIVKGFRDLCCSPLFKVTICPPEPSRLRRARQNPGLVHGIRKAVRFVARKLGLFWSCRRLQYLEDVEWLVSHYAVNKFVSYMSWKGAEETHSWWVRRSFLNAVNEPFAQKTLKGSLPKVNPPGRNAKTNAVKANR